MPQHALIQLKDVAGDLLKSGILPKGSYLAGGTAVYFYLHHRVSIDLDFFSESDFNPEKLLFKLQQHIENVSLEVMEDSTLIAYLTKNKTKFSMFHLPYPLIQDVNHRSLSPGIECPLASLEDIAAMKCIAIAQRGSAKDFFDLYAIINYKNIQFNDIFKLVKQKYNIGDNYMYHLKTSFVFFDDAENEVMSIVTLDQKNHSHKMDIQLWDDIKMFFKGYVR